MIRIAIVGQIGSGKTFVSRKFKYPIFNADEEVKRIYNNNKKCFTKLRKKFPNNIKKFPIKKFELRKIINQKNIKILSKIVHPYVRLSLNKFLKENRNKDYVVLDIPLFIENKLYKKSDVLIYVMASKKKIIQRLKNRGGYNKQIFNILKSQQLPINKKRKFCDFTIENNLGRNNIYNQVKKIKGILNDRNSVRH